MKKDGWMHACKGRQSRCSSLSVPSALGPRSTHVKTNYFFSPRSHCSPGLALASKHTHCSQFRSPVIPSKHRRGAPSSRSASFTPLSFPALCVSLPFFTCNNSYSLRFGVGAVPSFVHANCDTTMPSRCCTMLCLLLFLLFRGDVQKLDHNFFGFFFLFENEKMNVENEKKREHLATGINLDDGIRTSSSKESWGGWMVLNRTNSLVTLSSVPRKLLDTGSRSRSNIPHPHRAIVTS